MKKTLITLLAMAGVAFAYEEVTYTTTQTTSTGAADTGYECRGFAFNLSGTALLTTPSVEGTALTELVTLESITMTTRATGNAGKDGVYYIAITDDSLNILGWSDQAPTTAGTFTWTFENSSITLNTSETYYAIAYNDVSTLKKTSTLSAESTLEYMEFGTNALWKYDSGALNFDDATKGMTGLMLLNAGSYALNTNQTQIVPNVTIVTTSIPEPATATLSLLALASLCARRRRK